MKKHQKQQEIIDLDSFNDVSLFQLIPSGTGMGLSHLKTLVDSVHYSQAKLNSLLITGQAGLQTHASALIRALGIDNFNEISAYLLQHDYELKVFFCAHQSEAHILSDIENTLPHTQKHLISILKKGQYNPYNYIEDRLDVIEVPGLVVLTSKHQKKVPVPILDSVQHIVHLEDYTAQQLELIILQRLKYANIDYENEYILEDIVKYGKNNLKLCIRFLKCCIAVMQSQGRQKLDVEDVIKSARLNRLNDMDFENTIPF